MSRYKVKVFNQQLVRTNSATKIQAHVRGRQSRSHPQTKKDTKNKRQLARKIVQQKYKHRYEDTSLELNLKHRTEKHHRILKQNQITILIILILMTILSLKAWKKK